MEQLGYQAESGPWRNFYLSGAKELRDGVIDLGAPKTFSADVIRATPLEMFFDLLAVRLDGPKAADTKIVLNAHFTDIDERYLLVVENGVLNYAKGKQAEDADATLTLARTVLDDSPAGTGDTGRQAGLWRSRHPGQPSQAG